MGALDLSWRAATIAQNGQWRSAISTTTNTSSSFSLPRSTIPVRATSGFQPYSVDVGGKIVNCTGMTSTSFTGCSGGSGSVSNGATVTQSALMNFTGSTATDLGGFMNMFATRNYNYDTTLMYLQPPWFPVVESAYTVLVFRELPAG